jgi:hypothetical protein
VVKIISAQNYAGVDSWPQRWEENDNGDQLRIIGLPIAQWSRLAAGRSDDLATHTTETSKNGGQNQP